MLVSAKQSQPWPRVPLHIPTHPGPAARAALGKDGLIRPVHGRDREGGGRPVLAALTKYLTLVNTQRIKVNRAAEQEAALEAAGEDVA